MAGVETLVEVDFGEQDGGTLLQMRHSGFPAAAARDGHAQGWNVTLNKLTELLDARGTAATLTLFGDPRSTYVRSVRMGLAEKDIAYTLLPCAPRSPEVLAVHPFGRIPALRDGDFKVFETSAILRYLNECFGAPSLLPDSIVERARCEQWVSAINAYLYDTMVRRYVLQYVMPKGEGGRPDRSVIDAALPQIRSQLDLLNHAYEGADFLAGARVSIADLFLAPILAYVETMPEGAQLLDAVPHVRRAQGLMRQRSSFTTTEPIPAAN
jgi:glutathione S-transferase